MRNLILAALLLVLPTIVSAGEPLKLRQVQRKSPPMYVVWSSSRIGIHKSHIPIGMFNIPIFSPIIRRRHDIIQVPICR